MIFRVIFSSYGFHEMDIFLAAILSNGPLSASRVLSFSTIFDHTHFNEKPTTVMSDTPFRIGGMDRVPARAIHRFARNNPR